MTECVISISGITKNFSDVRALDNLDLQVTQGVFGLIGPNGAGKTTLIHSIGTHQTKCWTSEDSWA
jgi:ABC-2 type transport system ATP-binding protein